MSTLTIKDIAKQAGVAKSTVSRVLNHPESVSQKTREKVEKIIKENQYSPSATAQSLSKQESDTIGIVIPEIRNAFFGEILRGISDVAEENDLTMILCDTDNNCEKEKKALEMLRKQRVKGLILTPAADYSELSCIKTLRSALDLLNVPVVLVDRSVAQSKWDGVYFDNFNGAYMAVEALVNAGHKKIGTITGDLRLTLGRDRFSGFLAAMQDHDRSIDSSFIYNGDFSMDTAYKLTLKMIDSGNLPEALFISNNLTAMGFYKALNERGLSPGKDICCVGFDRVEALDVFNTNYSYIERDAVNMGKIAMRMLNERMSHQIDTRREYIIPAHLVLNGSERFV